MDESKKLPPDLNEESEDEKGSQPIEAREEKDIFSSLVDSLTLEELKNDGALKILLSNYRKQESEIKRLKKIEEAYHENNNMLSKYEANTQKNIKTEHLTDGAFTFGGLLLALPTFKFSELKWESIIFIVAGLALIIWSAITKYGKEK